MEKLKDKSSGTHTKILLPLVGSDFSLKAVLPAKTLAILLNAPIHILYISEELISEKALLSRTKIDPKELPEIIITRRQGDPAQEILNEARSARFIVMCSYGKRFKEPNIIGPVAEKVIENSSIPVVLVRPDSILVEEDGLWKLNKFLMPMDGTTEASQAYNTSIEIAEKTDAKIDVLHIFTDPEKKPEESLVNAPFYEDYPDQEWPFWSHEFIKRFCYCHLKHIPVDLALFKGDPSEAIINFYEENKSDLIVMAWKGELSPSHAEVLKNVLKNISCPLMLVKISHENLLQKPVSIE